MRDQDGRTYAAATVALPSLTLTALQLAVAVGGGGRRDQAGGGRGGDRGVHAGRRRARGGARPRRRRAGPRWPRRTARVLGTVTPSERPVRAGAAVPGRVRLLRRPAQRRQVDADQRDRRPEDRDHLEPSRRPPGTSSAACCTGRTPSSSSSTRPACTGPARCSASGSTTWSAQTWSEVDVIGLCIPADEPVGRGDRFIAGEIAELKATVIAVVTKTDLVDQRPPGRAAARGQRARRLRRHRAGQRGLRRPARHAGRRDGRATCRASPQLYPDDMLTDEPEQVLIAELIREAALEGVRDELPHSIAVRGRGDDPAEGRPDEDLRRPLRGAAEPEGDRHRRRGEPAQGGRHPRPRARSRSCSARGSTSTCTCGSPRTGSATRSSCASWASDPARRGVRPAATPSVGHGMFTLVELLRFVRAPQGRGVHPRPDRCRLMRNRYLDLLRAARHRPGGGLPRHRLGDPHPRLPGDVGDVRAGRLADGRVAGPVRAVRRSSAGCAACCRRCGCSPRSSCRPCCSPGWRWDWQVLLWVVPDRRPAGQRLGRDGAERDLVPARLPLVRAALAGGAAGCSAGSRCRPLLAPYAAARGDRRWPA